MSEGINRSIFVEGDTGVIAFDTFGSPMAAIAYQLAVQRVLPDKPVHTVVYTHDHLDHTGYAADLAPDARIIAHELTSAVVSARGSDGQLPATETWSGETAWYEIDGVRFQLIYPGPTHGDGNSATWFPRAEAALHGRLDHPWSRLHVPPGLASGAVHPDSAASPELDWDLFVPGHFWLPTARGSPRTSAGTRPSRRLRRRRSLRGSTSRAFPM